MESEEKTYALGFDVYGTLVDPLALAEPLEALVGEQAEEGALARPRRAGQRVGVSRPQVEVEPAE